MYIFCLLIFLMYIYIYFCSTSAFSRITELTVLCFTLQIVRPFRKR